MYSDELEALIKKNCGIRKFNVCDMFDTESEKDNPDDNEFIVDLLSTSQAKANKVGNYLKTLGFEIEITDGNELVPYDDNHPEWLMIHATMFH